MSNEIILQTVGATMSFGGLLAVNNVSMDVEKGSIHGLIGPNGAGKSTLFNMISGIYTPTSGTIIFNNEDITKLRSYQVTKKGIARTFQNILLFDALSALDNVMIGRHCRVKSNLAKDILRVPSTRREEALAREKAIEILDFLGLKDDMNKPAASFSYGRKRILEIGRALASEPLVLMLDEPAAGMNSAESKELIETISKVRDMGITVILVEHNMHVVMEICEKITVLDHGEHVMTGLPKEVRENPRVIEAYLGKEEA